VPSPRPATRRTQTERREAAESRLLTATADLIAEEGIVSTTLSEIGQRAGYSRGSVTHHFGSKGVLLQRLAASVSDTFAERMRPIDPAMTGLEGLLTLIGLYLDTVIPDRSIVRAHLLMTVNAMTLPEDLQDIQRRGDGRIRSGFVDMLRRGQADGTIRTDMDTDSLAVIIVGSLRGVVLQLWLSPEAAEAESVKATLRLVISAAVAVPARPLKAAKSRRSRAPR
jgi:AcrR family transcriptional regulator